MIVKKIRVGREYSSLRLSEGAIRGGFASRGPWVGTHIREGGTKQKRRYRSVFLRTHIHRDYRNGTTD
jgi:hypothetical protein